MCHLPCQHALGVSSKRCPSGRIDPVQWVQASLECWQTFTLLCSLPRSEALQGEAVHGFLSAVLWTAMILYQCACWVSVDAVLVEALSSAAASVGHVPLHLHHSRIQTKLMERDSASRLIFFLCPLCPFYFSNLTAWKCICKGSCELGAVAILRVTSLCIYRKSLDS